MKYFPQYTDHLFRGHLRLFVAIVMLASVVLFLISMWNLVKSDEPVKINFYETAIKNNDAD